MISEILGLTGDDATWIASAAAVLVVIIAIFGKTITSRLYGPKLKIEFDDEWECTEDGDYGKMFGNAASGDIDARIIRVKVVNTGKEPARKCYGKITRVYFNNREVQGFIPVHLTWASRQHSGVKLFKSKSEIDLAPEDADYLNVCVCWKANQEKLMPLAAYPFNADKYFPVGSYVFQISLFGSNCDAQSIKLKVKHSGEWFKLSAKEIR